MKALYSIIAVIFLLGVAMTVPQTVSVVQAQAGPGDTCTTNNDCVDNAVCTNSVCVCSAGYTSDAGTCVVDDDETPSTLDPWGGKRTEIQTATGLGDRDPRSIVTGVINIALGFLGIIAVLLILVGGFRWMTASGNDEQVAGAKNLMIAGVVGLVIVLAAFGIARFVVDALVGATSA